MSDIHMPPSRFPPDPDAPIVTIQEAHYFNVATFFGLSPAEVFSALNSLKSLTLDFKYYAPFSEPDDARTLYDALHSLHPALIAELKSNLLDAAFSTHICDAPLLQTLQVVVEGLASQPFDHIAAILGTAPLQDIDAAAEPPRS